MTTLNVIKEIRHKFLVGPNLNQTQLSQKGWVYPDGEPYLNKSSSKKIK